MHNYAEWDKRYKEEILKYMVLALLNMISIA